MDRGMIHRFERSVKQAKREDKNRALHNFGELINIPRPKVVDVAAADSSVDLVLGDELLVHGLDEAVGPDGGPHFHVQTTTEGYGRGIFVRRRVSGVAEQVAHGPAVGSHVRVGSAPLVA